MTDILPYLTFDDFVKHWAADRPERTALSEDDETWSFADLEEKTARVAAMLLEMGLSKGDRIAWVGKNSNLYFVLFYGAARLGVVMVPVGWRLAPPEWAFIIGDTKAKAVFTGQGFDGALDAIRDDLSDVSHVLGSAAAKALIDKTGRVRFEPAGRDDAVLQLYTSGTTGNPKGVVLSNRNLFALR